MKSKLKSILIIITGWMFIILGILGLFLPFLQGILFILIGLYILSFESPTAKKILSIVKHRFPTLHKKFEEAKKKAKRFFFK